MANPKWCVVQDTENVVAHPLIKMTDRLSLGINLSIFLILTIFATLLFLPLRLLLDTNYETRQDDLVMPESVVEPRPSEPEEIIIDFRALRICPGYRYSLLIKSIYLSDYDGNCTFFIEKDVVVEEMIAPEEDLGTAVVPLQEVEESAGVVVEKFEGRDQGKSSRTKSISMAGHILAAMLTVSSIVALVEVLRIRFGKPEGPSACGNVASRKGSLVDYSQRRYTHVKMQPQRSFEKQGIYTEARVQGLRLLGAKPPPLIRRSSFPTQLARKSSVIPGGGTPLSRTMSRRQSVDSEDEIGVLNTPLHHRTRLIRRH